MTAGPTHKPPADSIKTWLEKHVAASNWIYDGDAGGNSHQSLLYRAAQTGRRVVVRLEPAAGPFPSYDIVREATLLVAVSEEGLRVPEVAGVNPTSDPCGAPFVVTEWVEGSMLAPDPQRALDDSSKLMARVLATLVQIQSVPVSAERAADSGRVFVSRSFSDVLAEFSRALTRLENVNTLVLEFCLAWLVNTRRLASDTAEVLVHGDYRLGNLLWEPGGDCRVLDWEAAHLGSALFDLAWLCMGAVNDTDPVLDRVTKHDVIDRWEQLAGTRVDEADFLWWQVAAAWIRGCTEATLLNDYITSGPTDRDPQDLLWEFGSYRTDSEILHLVSRYDQLSLEGTCAR